MKLKKILLGALLLTFLCSCVSGKAVHAMESKKVVLLLPMPLRRWYGIRKMRKPALLCWTCCGGRVPWTISINSSFGTSCGARSIRQGLILTGLIPIIITRRPRRIRWLFPKIPILTRMKAMPVCCWRAAERTTRVSLRFGWNLQQASGICGSMKDCWRGSGFRQKTIRGNKKVIRLWEIPKNETTRVVAHGCNPVSLKKVKKVSHLFPCNYNCIVI